MSNLSKLLIKLKKETDKEIIKKMLSEFNKKIKKEDKYEKY